MMPVPHYAPLTPQDPGPQTSIVADGGGGSGNNGTPAQPVGGDTGPRPLAPRPPQMRTVSLTSKDKRAYVYARGAWTSWEVDDQFQTKLRTFMPLAMFLLICAAAIAIVFLIARALTAQAAPRGCCSWSEGNCGKTSDYCMVQDNCVQSCKGTWIMPK